MIRSACWRLERTPRQRKFSDDSFKKAWAMAWPKPPLAPVTRMTRVLMRSILNLNLHESCTDRLLVAAHDTDVRRRGARLPEGIHGEDALPGRRSHQAF